MKPLHIAQAHCTEKGASFGRLFTKHLDDPDGYMVSTPQCFAIGRPADFGEGRHGWLLEIAAGDLRALLRALPFDMPFIGFYRRGKEPVRVYPLARFKRLVRAGEKLYDT